MQTFTSTAGAGSAALNLGQWQFDAAGQFFDQVEFAGT
jgi:hypothetical protein